MTKADVVVVGGGVVGLFTAWELVRAGRRVLLCERNARAEEASWAGGGILMSLEPWRTPAALEPLLRLSRDVYPRLAEELGAATGIDPEWTRSGILMLNTRETDAASAWSARTGEPLEILDAAKLRVLEPAVHAPHGALRLPEVAQIRNPRLLKALYSLMPRLGVDLRLNAEVTGLEVKNGRVAALRAGAQRIVPEDVVIAAGAWSGGLLHDLGLRLPVAPVKGQMLLLQALPGLLSHMVLQDEAYIVPRRDGQLLVGSTVEDAGFDKTPTAAAAQALRKAAGAMVPALADAPVLHHWAGLRPGSRDELPYIGPCPGIDNLYVNSGHFRLGLTLAPASARLLADLMLNRAPCVASLPYGVGRR